MYSNIVGVTYDGRQELIKKLQVNEEVKLIREPQNPYDKNAVAVFAGTNQRGYLSREKAEKIALSMDAGTKYKCYVTAVTGGRNDYNYGAKICIETV